MDKRNGKLPLWENLEASARPKNRYSFECAAEFGNSPKKRLKWTDIREEVWRMSGIWHVKDLREIPDMLQKKGVLPEVFLKGSMDIATAVRRAEKETYFILYGYNRVEYSPERPNEDETACSAVYRKGTVKGSYERPGAVSRKKSESV